MNGGEPQENSRCINVSDFAADLQAVRASLSLSLSLPLTLPLFFSLCLFRAWRAPFTRKSIPDAATRSIDADSGPDGLRDSGVYNLIDDKCRQIGGPRPLSARVSPAG